MRDTLSGADGMAGVSRVNQQYDEKRLQQAVDGKEVVERGRSP